MNNKTPFKGSGSIFSSEPGMYDDLPNDQGVKLQIGTNRCSYPNCKNQAFDEKDGRYLCGTHKLSLDEFELVEFKGIGFWIFVFIHKILGFFRKKP